MKVSIKNVRVHIIIWPSLRKWIDQLLIKHRTSYAKQSREFQKAKTKCLAGDIFEFCTKLWPLSQLPHNSIIINRSKHWRKEIRNKWMRIRISSLLFLQSPWMVLMVEAVAPIKLPWRQNVRAGIPVAVLHISLIHILSQIELLIIWNAIVLYPLDEARCLLLAPATLLSHWVKYSNYYNAVNAPSNTFPSCTVIYRVVRWNVSRRHARVRLWMSVWFQQWAVANDAWQFHKSYRLSSCAVWWSQNIYRPMIM